MSRAQSDEVRETREALDAARQRFVALLDRGELSRAQLAAVFQQLEGCLAAGERLEWRQWRHLRRAAADRWRHLSAAACEPRLQQLGRRRQLLAAQQRRLDALLASTRHQLKLATAPANDIAARLTRKWESMRRGEEAAAEAGKPSGDTDTLVTKPWLIRGLTLAETCDRRKLMERLVQLEQETTRVQEMRDTRYRPIGDYAHCLRRFLRCSEKMQKRNVQLMKMRAEVRLHAGWIRDHFRPLSLHPLPAAPADGRCEPPPELAEYDRIPEAERAALGRPGPAATATSTALVLPSAVAAAAAAAAEPLSERILYSRLDAFETRALIAQAAERDSWYEIEFALVHGRLTVTADSVTALLVACRCRGRCQCQWTRLALAAQGRLKEKPRRGRGWAWRKVRMATQLIRLFHSTQNMDREEQEPDADD